MVQWWPMYRVKMCTSVVISAPFVVYYAGGVSKIMLAVTCGDHYAVLVNLHN